MAIPRFLLPTLLSLICGGAAMAADPLTFPWQGRLTVNEIPLTGSHSMVFSLLDSSSTELYNSGTITVQVTEGLAAVLVGGGSMPAIPASVANADGLVMHIILDGNTLSTDIPLVPAFRAHAISDGAVSEAKLDSAAAIKLNALATALSTSVTLGSGAASDSKVPSQLAVKTYVDNAVANSGGGGGGGATIDTSTTLGNSNLVVPSQLAVKTYVDNGNAALATSVTSEATTRASADTALNTAITNEATTRATAVATKLDASAAGDGDRPRARCRRSEQREGAEPARGEDLRRRRRRRRRCSSRHFDPSRRRFRQQHRHFQSARGEDLRRQRRRRSFDCDRQRGHRARYRHPPTRRPRAPRPTPR